MSWPRVPCRTGQTNSRRRQVCCRLAFCDFNMKPSGDLLSSPISAAAWRRKHAPPPTNGSGACRLHSIPMMQSTQSRLEAAGGVSLMRWYGGVMNAPPLSLQSSQTTSAAETALGSTSSWRYPDRYTRARHGVLTQGATRGPAAAPSLREHG